MRRDRHSRKHSGNWKNNSNNRKDFEERRNFQPAKAAFRPSIKSVSPEQIQHDEEAIKQFKLENQPVCSVCGQTIRDISTAINSKNDGSIIHFDCALELISKNENLDAGDKLTYIGQGRFGIVHFAVPGDTKHFSIKKIIDWEEKEKKAEWRDKMADLYSKVK